MRDATPIDCDDCEILVWRPVISPRRTRGAVRWVCWNRNNTPVCIADGMCVVVNAWRNVFEFVDVWGRGVCFFFSQMQRWWLLRVECLIEKKKGE